MNDVVGNARHSKIPYNTNDHKNEVGSICRREESITVIIYLINIYFEHIFLNLTNDATKNIGDW